MKESTVIRLSIYEIEILEQFRQDHIKGVSKALKKENNEVAKACYMSDIERFRDMKLSDLLSEYMRTMEYFKKGLINL